MKIKKDGENLDDSLGLVTCQNGHLINLKTDQLRNKNEFYKCLNENCH
jgi:hypothetical protein